MLNSQSHACGSVSSNGLSLSAGLFRQSHACGSISAVAQATADFVTTQSLYGSLTEVWLESTIDFEFLFVLIFFIIVDNKSQQVVLLRILYFIE